jgi:transcriptional regulator with PAS, ATPase and Fis domain
MAPPQREAVVSLLETLSRPEREDGRFDVTEDSLEWFDLGDQAIDPETKLARTLLAVPWRSRTYLDALDRLQRFSRSRHPILLVGESGAGKTAFAEAAHCLGPEPGEPFVTLNCASVPETLLESELFGHVRGAFTGADCEKTGLLASAGSGTVFLDEIDKASATFQAALLHVLDRGQVRPVGARAFRPVRARFVFATNRELASIGDRFLPDLAFRIGGMVVRIPPLRERIEDFELLLALALRNVRSEGLEGFRIARAARDLLATYPWPGNVRELFSVVYAAAHLAGGDRRVGVREIELAAFASHFESHTKRVRSAKLLTERIREFEREEILLAIRLEGGNQSRAARRLGLTRRGLNKKLHRLGLLERLADEGLCSFRRRRKNGSEAGARAASAESARL